MKNQYKEGRTRRQILLDDTIWETLQRVADQQGESVSTIVRQAILKELKRRGLVK